MFFRSSWEANYARYLNLAGKPWTYESRSFRLELPDGVRTFYTPDFQLSETEFHEVKGLMRPRALAKLKAIAKQYPDVRIVLIGPSEYSEIARTYASQIPNWEHRKWEKQQDCYAGHGMPSSSRSSAEPSQS